MGLGEGGPLKSGQLELPFGRPGEAWGAGRSEEPSTAADGDARSGTWRRQGRGRWGRGPHPALVAHLGIPSPQHRAADPCLGNARTATAGALTATVRTAGCGPARPVVWEGSGDDLSPPPIPIVCGFDGDPSAPARIVSGGAASPALMAPPTHPMWGRTCPGPRWQPERLPHPRRPQGLPPPRGPKTVGPAAPPCRSGRPPGGRLVLQATASGAPAPLRLTVPGPLR